jgi:hypothetical protein
VGSRVDAAGACAADTTGDLNVSLELYRERFETILLGAMGTFYNSPDQTDATQAEVTTTGLAHLQLHDPAPLHGRPGLHLRHLGLAVDGPGGRLLPEALRHSRVEGQGAAGLGPSRTDPATATTAARSPASAGGGVVGVHEVRPGLPER